MLYVYEGYTVVEYQLPAIRYVHGEYMSRTVQHVTPLDRERLGFIYQDLQANKLYAT